MGLGPVLAQQRHLLGGHRHCQLHDRRVGVVRKQLHQGRLAGGRDAALERLVDGVTNGSARLT